MARCRSFGNAPQWHMRLSGDKGLAYVILNLIWGLDADSWYSKCNPVGDHEPLVSIYVCRYIRVFNQLILPLVLSSCNLPNHLKSYLSCRLGHRNRRLRKANLQRTSPLLTRPSGSILISVSLPNSNPYRF
ncbi:hypothetical protein OSB04_002628 [Centaurea solstitialis]|uniref:Uncharacterized protein n=1 Tax=Centaurea solstitialis TaxID=347529 RepID=A0AA38WMZ4_9ASTR|nr:hypothetical protein OSB04_002628 [Centaurea solstitialis]